MWHVVVASIPAKTASPPRSHLDRQRRLWMSVARLSSSLARPARRRAVQTWSCIESTAIVTCTPAFAGSSSQQTGHRRKRALPQASDDRAQVAPGSHGHAKRDGTRIRANHADPHHYAQTRMSRPPPHVHGKEGVDGSSPSEGFWRLARRCEDRRALVADLGAHSVSAYGASVRMRHVHFSPNQLHAWPTPWLVNSSTTMSNVAMAVTKITRAIRSTRQLNSEFICLMLRPLRCESVRVQEAELAADDCAADLRSRRR